LGGECQLNGVNSKFIAILGLIYFVPVWIAIWNSATQYTGFKLWSILAKTAVILGILVAIGRFVK